jgi:hypothetical protein
MLSHAYLNPTGKPGCGSAGIRTCASSRRDLTPVRTLSYLLALLPAIALSLAWTVLFAWPGIDLNLKFLFPPVGEAGSQTVKRAIKVVFWAAWTQAPLD